MTTNELKSYIDRILGNSVRLLLPSYWWKRAFGAVIDKVDEKVEKSDLKTINGESILGSGNLVISTEKYPFRIWYSYDLTPAQKEDNVRAYNALMNKETFDFELLYIDEGEDYYSISREVVTGFTCHMDSQKVHINFLVAATEDGIQNESIFLISDGTFEVETPPL